MITISDNVVLSKEINMLRQLLEENQFELVDFSNVNGSKESGRIRLVYMMNDAAESFLIFENASLTGAYDSDYEGDLTAYLDHDMEKFALVVYQGKNAVTLFFRTIHKEVRLYNYARLGHFWVEGYEYLRQLEYHLAILRDKRDYLGEEFCNAEELELAVLTEFPPLNYCCYPAAPPEYVVPSFPEWKVSEAALQEISNLAKVAGDGSMLLALKLYRCFPYRFIAEKIAAMFHQNKHAALTDLLIEKTARASSVYENRIFTDLPELEQKTRKRIEKAAFNRIAELSNRKTGQLQDTTQRQDTKTGQKQGKVPTCSSDQTCGSDQTPNYCLNWNKIPGIDLIWEEPFTTSRDSIEMKLHLMIWDRNNHGKDRTVHIETFQ